MTPEKVKEVIEMYEKKTAELCVSSIQPASDVISHIYKMCPKVKVFLDEGRIEKAMRWLGFIQGALWVEGVYDIEEMKDHNRPKEDDAI